MRGQVRRRGEPGSWEYIVDVGLVAAQRCAVCVVALDSGTVEALKAQAARPLDEQKEWDEAWVDSGLVFTLANGKAMLPRIRLHDLMHTHVTLARQGGIHPKVVSERLGHNTIAITLDTYSRAIPALQEEAAALIAGLVCVVTVAGGAPGPGPGLSTWPAAATRTRRSASGSLCDCRTLGRLPCLCARPWGS